MEYVQIFDVKSSLIRGKSVQNGIKGTLDIKASAETKQNCFSQQKPNETLASCGEIFNYSTYSTCFIILSQWAVAYSWRNHPISEPIPFDISIQNLLYSKYNNNFKSIRKTYKFAINVGKNKIDFIFGEKQYIQAKLGSLQFDYSQTQPPPPLPLPATSDKVEALWKLPRKLI